MLVCCCRRTKEEVEKGMPPKLETTISCPLSEMQLFWYKRLLLKESALLKELEKAHSGEAAASGADWKKLSSLLMQLRKCCNHPFLFPGVEPAEGGEGYLTQLIDGSGKFQLLDRLLAKLKAGGHRVVLFSQVRAPPPPSARRLRAAAFASSGGVLPLQRSAASPCPLCARRVDGCVFVPAPCC